MHPYPTNDRKIIIRTVVNICPGWDGATPFGKQSILIFEPSGKSAKFCQILRGPASATRRFDKIAEFLEKVAKNCQIICIKSLTNVIYKNLKNDYFGENVGNLLN